MKLEDLSGAVVDQLYSALTGGTAELPLPDNMIINWINPGIPFHESAFDWAIAGPYAGPTPLTLDDFRDTVMTLMGEGEENGGGDGGDDNDDGDGDNDGGNQGMDRAAAIEEAKRMYQQHLLGSWEQWSRLVDFIPLTNPTPEDTRVTRRNDEGAQRHTSLVYAQAGQTLSRVYEDTLDRCEVAKEELTEQQEKLVERMKALLQEEVEVEDFLTGEKKIEIRESRVMLAYKEKKLAYENAVIDYASRQARANNGTAADLIEWTRSGGVYKSRAIAARREWIANGYKNDVERAQATINHILGSSMVAWKDRLVQDVKDIQENVSGVYGYPFFPSAILPGSFARNDGWSQFNERELHRKVNSSSSSRSGGARAGLNLGLWRFGASGGGSSKKQEFSFTQNQFGISFEFTQVEIARPAFNPNFFLSRGWRPKDSFIQDYGPLHSDGKKKPKGAMIGYPTKALFVRNLTIYSKDLATFMKTKQSEINGSTSFGWGPFSIGGNYAQSNKSSESNLDIQESSIRIKGIQLVAFLSALFPYTANPSPDVETWI